MQSAVGNAKAETEEPIAQHTDNKYDFIRFTWSDIHGIARCKLVPARHAESFFKHGISTFYGKKIF